MPKLPMTFSTSLEPVPDFTVNHTDWTGAAQLHLVYQINQQWSFADVYVNTHHQATSRTLAYNTNVQLGADGKHIMYCTMYAAKSNQKEDSDKFMHVVTNLAKQIRTHNAGPKVNQSPFEKVFCCLLSVVLLHVTGYTISAPLAAFIVQEGSQLIQLQDSTSLPLPALLQKDYYLRIKTHCTKSYFNNLLFGYQFHNETLDNVCLYKFFESFENSYVGKKGKNDGVMPYLSQHPGKLLNGTKRRQRPCVPILGYSNIVDASKFKGWNILDPNVSSYVIDPAYHVAMITRHLNVKHKSIQRTFPLSCCCLHATSCKLRSLH